MSLVQIILEGRKEDFARKFSNKLSEEQLRNIIDRSDVLPGQHKYLNFLGKVVNPKNFNADLNIAVKLLEKFSTVGQNLNLKDINQYDKISTLKKALDDYDNRIRREIKTVDDADVIYEDNEMIVVSPKTHKSSCYFGAGTKWCTTQYDNPDYFLRYSSRGILLYSINKNSGLKVATFYNLEPYDKEFSFWDDADNRVDSLETDLPHHILDIIRNEIKNNNHSNKSCLTEEERLIEELYWKNRNNLKLVSYDMPEVTQPDQPEVLSYYISCDDESPINVSSGGYINALGIWEP